MKKSAYVVLGIISGFCFIANAFGLTHWAHYADWEHMHKLIHYGGLYERYLLGSAVYNFAMRTVFSMDVFAGWRAMVNQEHVIRVFSTVCMTVASVVMLKRYGDRYAVIFLLSSPSWVFYLSGHVEIYPVVALACVLPVVYLAYGSYNLHPAVVGGICALVALSHFGIVSIALAFGLGYVLLKGKPGQVALWSAVAVYLIAALVFDKRLVDFGHWIQHNINTLNEPGTMKWAPYLDVVPASETWFPFWYALDPEHLMEVFGMALAGIGPVVMAGAVFGLVVNWRSIDWRNRRLWAAAPMVLVLGLIWVRFIPRWGPKLDIDVFWAQYLVFSFGVGLMLERCSDNVKSFFLIGSFFASGVIACLLNIGLA